MPEGTAASAGRAAVIALHAGIVCFVLPPIWAWLCGPLFFSYDTHLLEYVFHLLFLDWFFCAWATMLVAGHGMLLLLCADSPWQQTRPREYRIAGAVTVGLLAAMLSIAAFWSLPFVVVEFMRQADQIGETFRKAFWILWVTSPIDRAPNTLFKHLAWCAVLWPIWTWALLQRNRLALADIRKAAKVLLVASVGTFLLALSAHFAVVRGDRLQLMFVDWFTAFYVVTAIGVALLSLSASWQHRARAFAVAAGTAAAPVRQDATEELARRPTR
jgi:hypothetical protein